MFPITKKSPKEVCRGGGAYFSCHLVTLPHNPLPPKKRTVVVKAKQPTRLRTDTLHTLTLKKMYYTSIVFSLAYSHFMACHEGTSVSSKNINLSIVFLLAYSYLCGQKSRLLLREGARVTEQTN